MIIDYDYENLLHASTLCASSVYVDLFFFSFFFSLTRVSYAASDKNTTFVFPLHFPPSFSHTLSMSLSLSKIFFCLL